MIHCKKLWLRINWNSLKQGCEINLVIHCKELKHFGYNRNFRRNHYTWNFLNYKRKKNKNFVFSAFSILQIIVHKKMVDLSKSLQVNIKTGDVQWEFYYVSCSAHRIHLRHSWNIPPNLHLELWPTYFHYKCHQFPPWHFIFYVSLNAFSKKKNYYFWWKCWPILRSYISSCK